MSRTKAVLTLFPKAASEKPALGETSEGAPAPNRVLNLYATVLALPRPRPVRLTRKGVISIGLALITFLLAASAANSDQWQRGWYGEWVERVVPKLWTSVLFATLGIFLTVRITIDLLHQARTLRYGEVVLGEVTRCFHWESDRYVNYEYRDGGGQVWVGTLQDIQGEFSTGKNIVIVFDHQNPKRNVALSGSTTFAIQAKCRENEQPTVTGSQVE
jgi:hypothetical protein